LKPLYPVQETHVSELLRALETHGAALDASQTGTGKTICAAEIAKRLGRSVVLVVAPKAVLPSWRRELEERDVYSFVINYEKLRTGNSGFGKWERGNWVWNLPEDALIIFDECQRCQSPTSQNGKMLAAAKPFLNLMLSATAAEDPTEMRSLGYILGLHDLKNYWRWCKKWGCKPNPWGGLEFQGDSELLNQLHHQIFPAKGHRLTTADLADHFTETQIITEPIDFGDDVAAIYAEMEAEIANLAEIMSDDSDNPAAAALVAQLRARQQVELLKVPLMEEMANELLKEGRSVALFVNFEATLQALISRLEGALAIHGGQKDTEREFAINDFQNDVCRVIVCNIAAGGVGVSLHDVNGKYPRTAIISPSWSAKELLQTLGRVHRAGGKTPSQQRILFASGTVEEKVEKSVRTKLAHLEILNQGLSNHAQNMIDPSGLSNHTAPTVTQPMITDDSAHARYSPSQLKMFELCPSYLPRQGETNPAAEKGTRIHKALEEDRLDLLSPDELAIAQPCADFVEGLINHQSIAPVERLREVRLQIDLGGGLSTYGTCDELIVYQNHAVLVDFKTGYGAVDDAEVNSQAWAYVLGAFQKFPHLSSCHVYFLLPVRNEISHAQFSRSDIPRMQLRLGTIVRRAIESAGKTFNPQPSLCEYCGNQSNCQALADSALKIAGKAGLPVPSDVEVDYNDPENIAKLLRLAPIMESWAKGVKEAALKANLEEGIEIPGFRRLERSSPRSITSVAGAWEVVKDQVPFEEFLTTCTRASVVDLEELVASKAPKGKKTAFKQQLENNLRHADVLKDEGSYYFLKETKN